MGKGLIFFCCSCCILILTIVNLSIGPVISGKVSQTNDPVTGESYEWATANCKAISDKIDDLKDNNGAKDDDLKYNWKWLKDECTREKGMHDMEYTAFIFDIVIGFICGLFGLLHIFEVKKDFVSNTGLIGLICGIVGFVLTFVYVIFNGIVYTTYGIDHFKIDEDSIFAKRVGTNQYECIYFDKKENLHSFYPTYSDLIKKQYNYDKDSLKGVDDNCILDTNSATSPEQVCIVGGEAQEKVTVTANIYVHTDDPTKECENLYYRHEDYNKITNKDISDRFLTALILSLFVCLANIGLAIFGFLLFRTPGDF